MGTRSRLIIYRPRHSTKGALYLWMHWDGYFDGVGNWLCEQIKLLLEKYTIPEIQGMLEELNVRDGDSHDFDTKHLIPFIEGKTEYGNDMCDDIEYEYRLDFNNGTFEGTGHGETRILRLDQIRAGKNMTSEDDASSDKVDMLVEMVRTAMSTMSESEKRSAIEKISIM